MEAKLLAIAPSAHPIASPRLPRTGEFLGQAVRPLPAGTARGSVRALAQSAVQSAVQDAIPSLTGPLLSARDAARDPQARTRGVSACVKAFRSALAAGGQAGLVHACRSICDGAPLHRHGDALQAAMIITAPDGVAHFRAVADMLSTLVGDRDDDPWGKLVYRLWQASEAAQDTGAQSGQAQAPRAHLLACLAVALHVEGQPVIRLRDTLDHAWPQESVELACDAFAALVLGGQAIDQALAMVLQVWDENTVSPLIQALLFHVTPDTLLSCIRTLVTPDQLGREPRMLPEHGAEALVALAMASFADETDPEDLRDKAIAWLATQVTPVLRAPVLDQLFETFSGFESAADAPVIQSLGGMIEAAAAQADPAQVMGWLLALEAGVQANEGKSPARTRLRLPETLTDWTDLTQACQADPLTAELFDSLDFDSRQKRSVAAAALRRGRWTPQESARQLQQVATANLRREDRIDLLGQVLRRAQQPAAQSLFLAARSEALRQWCIVAADSAGVTEAASAQRATRAAEAAGFSLNFVYRCWAEQSGWIDAEGRLRPLSDAQRQEFRSFLRMEEAVLRDTPVHGVQPQRALSLLARYANDLGDSAALPQGRDSKGRA